jgi:hypothetical protein
MKRFYEQGKIDKKWVNTYCKSKSNWLTCIRYQMEENNEYHPDWMLPDGSFKEELK